MNSLLPAVSRFCNHEVWLEQCQEVQKQSKRFSSDFQCRLEIPELSCKMFTPVARHRFGLESRPSPRLSQLLKGAVVVTLCQNEAEVKCQMDIYSHISLTEQAGKISLISPAWSVDEIWCSISLDIFSSASLWQRIVPTAPLYDWYFEPRTLSWFASVHVFALLSPLLAVLVNQFQIPSSISCRPPRYVLILAHNKICPPLLV